MCTFVNSRWYRLRSLQILTLGLGLFLALSLTPFAAAQIENGGFESSTSSWGSFGETVGIAVNADAYDGAGACLVTGRTASWQGITQSLLGDLETAKDYHFTAYVKLADPGSHQMRFELKQVDDGNNGQAQYLKIADVTVSSTEWTLLEGGFTFYADGPVTELSLIINGTQLDQSNDGEEFDFLVDSVQITENDWRSAANDRIEQLRKRDIEFGFVDQQNNPATGLEVNVQQISHQFGFGSALNDIAVEDPVYAEFFKQHFEWATFEWGAQWRETEAVQGVEDYSRADFSIDYVQTNGIKMKGHALAYPATKFLPDWLLPLASTSVQSELDERIESAATRYRGELFGWDVANELLDEDWLTDTLGESVIPEMFQQAREIDPEAVLMTNENSLTNSKIKTKRYRQLLQGLIADGADVGGIGLQAHFYGGFVSPKAMEITMSELTDFGIDLWFTEFDLVHPNPEVRADSLEDFYRYAFSRPEARGVVMWGFWAGTHWRGEDASLVDLDWTINAQGQRYLDLMEEWTTELDSNSGEQAKVQLRGFNGNYLVTTVDPLTSITNYHLVVAEPGTDPQAVTLVTNSTKNSLSIYGTAGDDLFEFDLEATDRVDVNGQTIVFNLPTELSVVRFVGLEGEDRIETLSTSETQHFKIQENSMMETKSRFLMEYEQIETAYFYSRKPDSAVTFVDSAGDDTLTSYYEESTLETPSIKLIAANFCYLKCNSTAGNDTAWMHDTPGLDNMYTNLSLVTIRRGAKYRRIWDFAQANVVSTLASDIATFVLPVGDKTISVSPSLISVEYNGKQVNAIGMPRSTITVAAGNSDSVSFSGDDGNEVLRVAENRLHYTTSGGWANIKNINQSTHSTDSGGYDRVIFTGSAVNDTLTIDQDTVSLSSATMSHSWMFMDHVWGKSSKGGTDTSTVTNPTAAVVLNSDWK